MTPKTFSFLAVSTLVAVAAAVVSVSRDAGYRPAVGAGEKAVPGLLERVNDVAKVIIVHAGGTITLENGARGWTMKGRDGYPARTVKIKRTVLGLAQSTLSEAKTRRKEKYAKLELQDIGAPRTNKDAKSKRVKLFDAKGQVLADILIGKRLGLLAGTTGGGMYVRKPGDEQTWLAAGDADFTARRKPWLERKITDIKADRVRSIVIRHPDGETVTLAKAFDRQKDFTLANMPEGKSVISQLDINSVGKALADLQLDDVRKDDMKAGGSFDAAKTTTAEFLTFDGLFVQASVMKKNGAFWLRIEATGDKSDEITARTRGWIYKISNYTASTLTKRLADMVEDAKPKS